MTTYLTARLPAGVPRKKLRRRNPAPRGVGMIPADVDFSMTADHLYEVPRETRVIPTGVLDGDGNMICRVHIPIKQQLGFNTGGNAWTGDVEEEVVLMQTANLIRMSDCGMGIESIDPSELDDFEDEEEEGDDHGQ